MLPATVHSSTSLRRTIVLQNKGQHLWLLLLVCVLFSCGSSKRVFNPNKKYSAQHLQQDYQLFQNILEERHPGLYWYSSKATMDSAFQWGNRMITDSMSEVKFRTVLVAVVAHIKCGHTSVQPSRVYQKFLDTTSQKRSFPVAVKTWKDTMVLTVPIKGALLQRGDILDSINGIAVSSLIDTLFRFIPADGGNAVAKSQLLSGRHYFSTLYTSLYGWPGTFRISYLDSVGLVQQALIQPARVPKDSLIPKPVAKTPQKSKAEKLKESRSLKLYEDQHYAVMELNSFGAKLKLKSFFRQSFRTLKNSGIDTLVIDLRVNGGGRVNNATLFTRYLVARSFKLADSLYAVRASSQYNKYIQNGWLQGCFIRLFTKKVEGKYRYRFFEKHYYKPKRHHHFNGQVYLLCGGYTYSASVLALHALKNQSNVLIVGEPTGGGAYGNCAMLIPDVTLPNSKVRFRLPLFRLVIDKNLPHDGQGLQPDIFAGPSQEAIRRGEDYKMKKVRELILEHQQHRL